MEMKVQVSKITMSIDSIPDLVLVGAYLVPGSKSGGKCVDKNLSWYREWNCCLWLRACACDVFPAV